jgi:hypothetical protein
MSNLIVRHALDTAKQQPTTAGKIAAFLRVLPRPSASWWEHAPSREATLDWLAHVVEQDEEMDRTIAVPAAPTPAMAERAEKAEGGRDLDDDRRAEATLAASGGLANLAFQTELRDILHNLWCDSRRCPGPPGSRDYDVVLAYAERRLVALMQARQGGGHD